MIMVRYFRSSCLLCLPLTLTITLLSPTVAQVLPNSQLLAQSATPSTSSTEEAQEDLTDPNNARPLAQSDSLLSLQRGEQLMQEASEAVGNEQYEIAATKLQQARKIFNQLSNFHLQLANSFSGIDPKVVDSQRTGALKAGQMRDDATYQLALVHRAQNQPELAVPLLIQVIRSQNPTSPLGRKSYQQLYELGFVDIPFGDTPPPPPSNPPQ
jgi:hypothetical protein